jgi:hypothetical protein
LQEAEVIEECRQKMAKLDKLGELEAKEYGEMLEGQ